MASTSVDREIRKTRVEISELLQQIKEQQSKYEAAVRGSESEKLTAYKEEKVRLVADKHNRMQQLTALQPLLTLAARNANAHGTLVVL